MIGKLSRPTSGFVLPYHKYKGSLNLLNKQLDEDDQPLPEHEPPNAADAIFMHYDICYRDNNTKEGQHRCDDAILQELDWL